ncbi:MAG: bifunctional pyr operon transcriptional regulator/uracil phosphoribosyltransferase PyrR [Actinomycetota bacterium]
MTRISHEILERNPATPLALVGLVTRGATLATRLADRIERIEGDRPPVGTLDIGLFRDDLDTRDPVPLAPTQLPSIDGLTVVLVDDVLYTGRSVRAALEALLEFGRPKAVQLAVMVDRGHRELPIRPDFVGKNIPTRRNEEVRVLLQEHDETDEVLLGTVEDQ